MNRNIVFSSDTGESGTVKSGFTVPSKSKDVRVVAESSERAPLKRKFFKVMTKETKASQRPARKIKLNRSIFNAGFEGKPSFHVKTLDEIKSEKKQLKETTRIPTEPDVNNTTTVQTVVANNSVDTRKVLKLNSVKKLMLPTIRLTRVSSGKYSRSITKTAAPANDRRIIRSEAALRRFKENEVASREAVSQPPVMSPQKKRKTSPIRTPKIEPQTQPTSQSIDTTWSTSTSLLSVSPEQPPSPPLSLGAQSDHELNNDPEPEITTDARVVIKSEDEPNENHNGLKELPMKRSFQLHSDSGFNSSLVNGDADDDDRLDVMSIMADDDELFLDEKPRPVLKRSLSQDSVFNRDEQDSCGDLRNFLKQHNDVGSKTKQSVGDLISSRPVSKAYRIPHVNQSGGKMPNNHFVNDFLATRNHVKSRHENPTDIRFGRSSEGSKRGLVGNIPSGVTASGNSSRKLLPTREGQMRESHNRKRAGCGQHFPNQHGKSRVRTPGDVKELALQEQAGLLDGIKTNLEHGNVGEAWNWIKKLDQMKCSINVRLLQGLLKTCERVSQSNANPVIGDVALSAFEFIMRFQGEAKPTDFILVILCLCRCQKIQEAFDKYLAMKVSRKLPQGDVLEIFIDSLCKCLVFTPCKIIEVLQDVKMFPLSPRRKLNIMNKCIVSLISSPPKKLREVGAEMWNSLLTILCSTPTRNVQSALQVHNLMEQNGVPLSPSTTVPLFKVFQESNSTRPLLKLITSKICQEELAKHRPPIDVGRIILSPTLNVRSVEESFSSLLKEGLMPNEDLLNHFITKASHTKEYDMIYQFFLKCERSSSSLPLSTLKEMMDALENWDENTDASVQVYTSLRKAKKGLKQPSASTVVRREGSPMNSDKFTTNSGQKKPSGVLKKPCFKFRRSGSCAMGDKCRYSHVNLTHQQFSSHESEHSERESIGESQSPKESGKFVELPGPLESKIASSLSSPHNSASVNSRLVNGIDQNPPNTHVPFPSFQVFNANIQHLPVFNPRQFNPQLFNQIHDNRSKFQQQFQRNPILRVPRFVHTGKRQPRGPGKQPPCGTPPLNTSRVPMVHNPAPNFHSPTPRADKVPIGRTFSWEPASKIKPNNHLAVHPNRRISHASDNNNNDEELQHSVEMAVKSKEWQMVYTCYVECKGSNGQPVKSKHLQIFRNGFVKDPSSGIGKKFRLFVEFLYKENNSGRSSQSNQNVSDVFDQYDMEFIGALGVSLMEKCLVLKQFDDGYEVLFTLHTHNISYFHSGKNFGAYNKDIPPQNVALIAVKLCLGIPQYGGLGAMEVLRACNFALGEEGELLTPQDEEYRIKVLHQLFLQLIDEGHILLCHELIQNINADANVMGSMYLKILNHHVDKDAFDDSFTVLTEMQEKGVDLNRELCRLLYEKFLKHCIMIGNYGRAAESLNEIELRGISMKGDVLRDILNTLSSAEQDTLAKPLFEKCSKLDVYPTTFCLDTPWLCELSCGYSNIELRLLIQKHLEQLHNHLLSSRSSDELITAVRDFQIALYPRLSGVDSGIKFTNGIQKTLANCATGVERILQQDFNPPLTISEQSGEQFHKKMIVERMSVYRWFNANARSSEQLVDSQEEYETSSQGSIASNISDLSN